MQTFAICIGAQKSGTTWLFRCLQEHPSICAFDGKEAHFFSDTYTEDTSSYLQHFTNCTPEQKINFEASVSYLAHPHAATRIKAFAPTAKLIVILRDPVERTFSHYLHYKSRNRITADTSLGDAIIEKPELVENSLYGKHMQTYLKTFAREHIHIIPYESLSQSPQSVMEDVCQFLDIAPFTPDVLTKKYHSSQSRSHALYLPIARKYRKLRTTRLGRLLIDTLRAIGVNNVRIDSVLKKTAPNKPVLQNEDREMLIRTFAADQALLQKTVQM